MSHLPGASLSGCEEVRYASLKTQQRTLRSRMRVPRRGTRCVHTSIFCSLDHGVSDWPLVQRQDTRLWIWEWWFESTGANPPSRAGPMTPHPTVRALRFVLASCCLLTESIIAQGLPRARPEDVGLSTAALERIAPALQSYVDSGQIPGFLALVARHGKLAYLSAGGWMDVEQRRAMSPDAVLRIYSLTKPIASTAVMQLYERGTLRLDDPVSKYIPAFAAVKGYAGGRAPGPGVPGPQRPVTPARRPTPPSGLCSRFLR